MKKVSVVIPMYYEQEVVDVCYKRVKKVLDELKEKYEHEIIFINDGKIVSIKCNDNSVKKRNVIFEVDDYSRARMLLNNYCINEELEVYESDEKISELNRELVLNNINVYRIVEHNKSLEQEFFDMVGNHD